MLSFSIPYVIHFVCSEDGSLSLNKLEVVAPEGDDANKPAFTEEEVSVYQLEQHTDYEFSLGGVVVRLDAQPTPLPFEDASSTPAPASASAVSSSSPPVESAAVASTPVESLPADSSGPSASAPSSQNEASAPRRAWAGQVSTFMCYLTHSVLRSFTLRADGIP